MLPHKLSVCLLFVFLLINVTFAQNESLRQAVVSQS